MLKTMMETSATESMEDSVELASFEMTDCDMDVCTVDGCNSAGIFTVSSLLMAFVAALYM